MSATPEVFVGRLHDRRMFQNSVHAILAPPGQRAEAANVFLLHGEHGMGKSALLHQFGQIARATGVLAQRTILVDLANNQYNTARDLATTLAIPFRNLSNRALATFDDLHVERFRLQPQYEELCRQWERWQVLQSFGKQALDGLLDQYTVQGQHIARTTLFGTGPATTHAASQLERTIEDISWVLQFRHACKRSPVSFDELLDWALKASASLFRNDARFGSALAGALNRIASSSPIVLLVDSYEHADAHDDWMRGMVSQLNQHVLLAIAGRRRLGAYAQTFAGSLASRIAFVDCNIPLEDDDVGLYLAKRLGLASAHVTPQQDEVITVAAGVPLVLAALGDQLANGGTLAPYRDVPTGTPEPDGYQRALVARFFQQVLGGANGGATSPQARLHDRQRLRMMALLRPDAELLAAAWGLSIDEAIELDRALVERYSFIFHGSMRFDMHPLVREIAQADARAARKRHAEWQPIAAGLQRALNVVRERISQLEAVFPSSTARYAQADWRQAMLDQLQLLMWLGQHEQAWSELLNHWVEARYESPAFAQWLFERAADSAPRGAHWAQTLAALQTADYDLLAPLGATLPPQTRATLGVLRARRLHVPAINAATVATLDQRIALLQVAVAEAPTWSPALGSYAEALSARGHYELYSRGDYEAALRDFSALIELDPKYRAAYSRRGFAHHALGNYQAAIEDYSRVLNMEPGSATARFGRAAAMALMYDQKRWTGDKHAADALLETALADLDQVIAQFPDDHMAHYYRGLVYYCRNEPAHAARDLRAARVQEPNHAPTHSVLALAWAELAKQAPQLWQTAANTAQLACVLAPDNADVWTNRGVVALDMQQFVDAASAFERALALRPDHAPTLFYRSQAHLRFGDWNAALDDIEHAIVQQPDYPNFHTVLAEIRLRQADRAGSEARENLLQQAQASAEQALQLRPRDARALVWRTHAIALQSPSADTMADVTLAMSLDATNMHAYAVRGMLRQGDAAKAEASEQPQRYFEALNDLNAALAQNDEWAETFARRGLVRHAIGQHEDAVQDFDRALAIRQNDPLLLLWRGKAQAHDLSKQNEAKQNFSDSLHVQPNQPDALYERGCLLLASGDAEHAAHDFEAVLRLRPNDAHAIAKLAEAKRRSGNMIGAMPHYWTQVGMWTRKRLAR